MMGKKRTTKNILLLLIVLLLVVTGCNSREDVFLSSVDEVTKYVEAAIDEPIKYVKTVEFKEHNSALYIYMLEERGIEFEVEVSIGAESFEALQLSNYHEEIRIKYEEAIMLDEEYVEKRLMLAEKYNVSDEFKDESGTPYFWATIEDFSELESIAEYIKAVDELYLFREKKSDKIEHIGFNLSSKTVGVIYASEHGERFKFSKNEKDEINEKDLLEQLQRMYEFFKEFRGRDGN